MPAARGTPGRAISDRNLKRAPAAPLGNQRHLEHGGYSERLIQGSAMAYLAELVQEFPTASERVLRLQARRLAKLDRLATYLEGRGEIRNRRTGEVFAASALEERITAAYLAEHVRLEERERGMSPGDPLAGLAVEGRRLRMLAEARDDGGAA